jgi:hypothetical protein
MEVVMKGKIHNPYLGRYAATLVACLCLALAGCSDENPLSGAGGPVAPEVSESGGDHIYQEGAGPPSGLVTIGVGAEDLTIWPYTGVSFDGAPQDPINLVFADQAEPVEIRAALLALDGDRTEYGFPPVPPFNATWSEAIGDVQTAYAEGEGWIGNVIQLQLGAYEPVRVHLRLFRTGSTFGEDGVWTLGGAHFEIMIPGTADHQVLSWEIAEAVIVADLVRSGLLDSETPLLPTGPINASPSFREIPPYIYNLLPEELIILIGGPPPPVADPVPIASDGEGTILNLATGLTVEPDEAISTLTVEFNQIVPKPFCSDGPLDWLLLTGSVDFSKTARIGLAGRYTYHAHYSGTLIATPVDITVDPPVPIGDPFEAIVNGTQNGFIDERSAFVQAQDKRVAPQEGGTESHMTRLHVATHGKKTYSCKTRCIE